MNVWLILLVFFLLALVFVVLPLLRNRDKGQIIRARDQNLEVYKAQLTELETDQKQGLLSEEEYASARLEVERRLLKAAEGNKNNPSGNGGGDSISLPVTIGILVMLGAVAFYMYYGMPGMRDFPLKDQQHSIEQRAKKVKASDKMIKEVADLTQHLETKPDDIKAWHALGQYQTQLGNRAAAAQAFQKWYELEPDSLDVAVIYGESLIMLADGRIGPAALLVLNKARAKQPRNPGVRHYLALYHYQNGNLEQALADWKALEAESRPDVPWIGQLRRWIRRAEMELGRTPSSPDNGQAIAPAISDDERKAIEQMSAEEQMNMIRGMVAQLQEKMDANPENIEGWFRLAKAYIVLKQKDDAVASLKKALNHAPDDLKPEIKKQLEILQKQE